MYRSISSFMESGKVGGRVGCSRSKKGSRHAAQDTLYVSGQPLPSPPSLMIAFTATYPAGKISICDTGIEEAGWFTINKRPPLQEGSPSLTSQSAHSL